MPERPEMQKAIGISIPLKPDRLKMSMPMNKTQQALSRAIDYFGEKHPEVKIFEPSFERSTDTVTARLNILNRFTGSHLFMMDGDQGMVPETLARMYEATEYADVVLAPSVKAKVPYEPTFGYLNKNGKFRRAVPGYDYDNIDILNDVTLAIDGGGFPAVMIRREAFDEIPPEIYGPAFNRIQHPTQPESCYGHDLSFCLRCRAAGLKVVILMGVKVPHFSEDGWVWLNFHEQMVNFNPYTKHFHDPVIKENNLVPRRQQRMRKQGEVENAKKDD